MRGSRVSEQAGPSTGQTDFLHADRYMPDLPDRSAAVCIRFHPLTRGDREHFSWDLQRQLDGFTPRSSLRFHGSRECLTATLHPPRIESGAGCAEAPVPDAVSRGLHSRPHCRHGRRPRSGRRPASAWRRRRHGRRRGRACPREGGGPAREGGVHRDEAPRLVGEHMAQRRSAGVENDPVEPSLLPEMAARGQGRAPGAARHAPHLQILEHDGMRGIGERPARPVLPVAPFPGNRAARLREPGARPLPVPGAALLARQPPGETLRPGLQAACVRGMKQPPVARRHLARIRVEADGGPSFSRPGASTR